MDGSSRRTLVLVRHAKAGYPEGAADHDRPLTSRGERDAQALGGRLREGAGPDLVLCSTATRARETWDRIERAWGRPATVRYEPSAYLASARVLLGLVRGADSEVTGLVVVGHNPGLHELARDLASSGDAPGRALLGERFSTSTAAVLAVDGPWDGVGSGTAELLRLLTPGE